jgi:hypothetical protein
MDPASIPQGQSPERPGGNKPSARSGVYVLKDKDSGKVVAQLIALNEPTADGLLKMGYQFEREAVEKDFHRPEVVYGSQAEQTKQDVQKVLDDVRSEAKSIVEDAKKQAEAIIENAKKLAESQSDSSADDKTKTNTPKSEAKTSAPEKTEKVLTTFKVGEDVYTEVELDPETVETRKNDKKIKRADFEKAKADSKAAAEGGEQ